MFLLLTGALVLWEIPFFFFLFSFFRTDVDVGVDGGNDGVGRFMMGSVDITDNGYGGV